MISRCRVVVLGTTATILLASAEARSAPAPVAPAPSAPIDTPPATDGAGEGAPTDVAPPDVIGEALAPRPGGLTAAKVASRAVATSPSIAAKEADLQAAAARVDQVMASLAPVLSVSASYTRLSNVDVTFGSGALVGALEAGPLVTGPCPDGTPGCVVDSGGFPVVATQFRIPQVLDNFSLVASLSVPLSDYVLRSVPGLRAAKASAKAAELAQLAEARKVRTDAKVAYYNWLRAVAQVAVVEDALSTAQARLRDAQTGFRVGVLTKADLLRVEALAANADRAVVSAKTFERLARRNLAILMGQPEGTGTEAYTVGEDVLAPVVADADEDLDALVAEAERSRPELQMIGQNKEALRRGIEAERAGYYPRLDAFGDVLYANPNPRYFPPVDEFNESWQVGARLSYSITGAIQTRQRIKELRAQNRSLEAQIEGLRRGIEMEITQAWAERRNARAAIALARVAREASETAYAATVAQFRAGKATATDLIAAQGEHVNAQLQYVNAHIDLRVAEAKLRYATGRDDPDSA